MMRRQIGSISAATFALAVISCIGAQADTRQFIEVEVSGGPKVPAAYHLPSPFDPAKAYPVLVASGDGTPGSSLSFFWRQNLPPKLNWILVETPAFWADDPEEATRALFGHLRRNFQVEGGKFHLLGWSAGSAQTFSLAAALADDIASVTGIPGHPSSTNREQLEAYRNLKVHFIAGENDGYWLDSARRAHRELEEMGIDSTLDIIEDGGHVLKELRGEKLLQKMEKMRLGQ